MTVIFLSKVNCISRNYLEYIKGIGNGMKDSMVMCNKSNFTALMKRSIGNRIFSSIQ